VNKITKSKQELKAAEAALVAAKADAAKDKKARDAARQRQVAADAKAAGMVLFKQYLTPVERDRVKYLVSYLRAPTQNQK